MVAHINAYLLQTMPHPPKGASPTKKKSIEEASSSNLPLAEVVKKSKAKRKLAIEEEEQSNKTPKIPKASKLKGKGTEQSKRKKIEKPKETKEIQDEGAKSANTEATCENPSIQQIYADAHLTLQMANKVILEAMY
nr:hypothetical protein Iba_chr07cCG7380 [Ipomoea batatas]